LSEYRLLRGDGYSQASQKDQNMTNPVEIDKILCYNFFDVMVLDSQRAPDPSAEKTKALEGIDWHFSRLMRGDKNNKKEKRHENFF
jgi:hypothetical protein